MLFSPSMLEKKSSKTSQNKETPRAHIARLTPLTPVLQLTRRLWTHRRGLHDVLGALRAQRQAATTPRETDGWTGVRGSSRDREPEPAVNTWMLESHHENINDLNQTPPQLWCRRFTVVRSTPRKLNQAAEKPHLRHPSTAHKLTS